MRAIPCPEFTPTWSVSLRVVRKLLDKACQLGMHFEGDAKRPLSVIVMADGSTEQRHQRVPGELLDVAAVATDDTAEAGDDGVDHLEQVLRVEAVRERREARDVREQSRDEPPLLRQRASGLDQPVGDRSGDEAPQRVGDVLLGFRSCSLGGSSPAVSAELHFGSVLAAAIGADPDRHRLL